MLNGYSLVLYWVSLSLYLHIRHWNDLVGLHGFSVENYNLYSVSDSSYMIMIYFTLTIL